MKKNCLLILFLILGFKISAQSILIHRTAVNSLENNTMSKNATNDWKLPAKKWETVTS